MLREDQGCQILAGVFAARGYPVKRDVPFAEGKVSFEIDGFNAEHRVGFEFRTDEAGDKDDLDDDELLELARRMEANELFIFVIDDVSVDSEADLTQYAHGFLDEVERRVGKGQKGRALCTTL
jgi:hypothetical protein